MSKLADLIWKNAELLRGAYKENEYRKVILPFTILRRLDCVLEPTRNAVRARHEAIRTKNYDLDKMLTPVSGYPFFNTWRIQGQMQHRGNHCTTLRPVSWLS